MFKIDLQDYSIKEFLNEFEWYDGKENKKNIDYIKKNLKNIIEQEEDSLEELVDCAEKSCDFIKMMLDNKGEMIVNDDDGEELGSIGFYTEFNY